MAMDEAGLRREAESKRTDFRYPPALKTWLRGQLLEVYSRKMPAEQVARVLDEVWPVDDVEVGNER